MIKRAFDNRTFWGAVGVLALLTLVLGLRARSTVATVLDPDRGVTPYEAKSSADIRAEMSEVGLRDSLLVTAVPGDRDPFEFPRVRRATRAKSVQTSVERKDTPPVLRTLLYDNVDPGVRISIGSRTSGWLHVGDTFSGWTIDEITSNAVVVSNGTKRIRLDA